MDGVVNANGEWLPHVRLHLRPHQQLSSTSTWTVCGDDIEQHASLTQPHCIVSLTSKFTRAHGRTHGSQAIKKTTHVHPHRQRKERMRNSMTQSDNEKGAKSNNDGNKEKERREEDAQSRCTCDTHTAPCAHGLLPRAQTCEYRSSHRAGL